MCESKFSNKIPYLPAVAAKRGDKWIQTIDMKKGAFRKEAEKRGLTTRQFAQKVISNPSRYSKKLVRRARLALTLMGLGKRRSKNN
jgi:hypothetical protein